MSSATKPFFQMPADKYTFWEKCWENEKTPWHLRTLCPALEKYKTQLLNGKTDAQIFFPLCGKCVDMMQLYKEGHRVVGVEFCKKAIEDFFNEQNLPYKVQEINSLDGSLYQSEDERLKIYQCDFFKFNSDYAGMMDAVWDRGSFIAIEKEDRKKYAALITSLLAPGFRYLLITLNYKDWFYSGAPRAAPEQLIYYLFGKDFDIDLLQKSVKTDKMITTMVEDDSVEEHIWLFKGKN